MKKISLLLLLAITVSFTSCSWVGFGNQDLRVRGIASPTGQLEHLLGIDRFHYYINEFANFQDGKLDDEVIEVLRSIKAQDLIDEGYSVNQLSKAQNYDTLIFNYLTNHYPALGVQKSKVKWNYNFLKNKLNEGFSLKPTRMEEILYHDDFVIPGEKAEQLTITNVNPDKLTLDSGHYISNRTTRAAFWDAVSKDRKVEFHLGDSREFLKNISANQGEILYEVKPLARNYNKIFLVKYPGESEFRVAVTNIGGADRLEHMIHHLSLSKLTKKKLKNKVIIYGNLEAFHDRLFKKLSGQMKHLPKADRVMIGQKGAIDGVFNIHWKLEGMRALYAKSKTTLKTKIGATSFDDLEGILKGTETDFDIFSIKKLVETSFEKVKTQVEADASIRPPVFRKFSSDNTTTEMADYVFKNAAGKELRWRVIGNVWGDEIVPLAKALKATGNTNITYMGTTGALPEKGYQVGDLVIPSHARDAKGKVKFRGTALNIEGAKTGGIVEHVASPFDETQAWLKKVKAQSDMVEIETNYLARIFNGSNDHMRAYLLVSDVLGDEGGLANASSSKRRKSLNSLLNALLKRDKAVAPRAMEEVYDTKVEKLRGMIDELFAKKGATLRYYLFSHFKDQTLPSLDDLKAFEDGISSFSDNYFNQRIVSSSEALSNIVRRINENDAMPKIGIDKEFVNGKWHPKNGKIKIQLYATTAAQEARFKAVVDEFSGMVDDVSNWSEFEVVRGPPPAGMVTVKPTSYVDQDFLVKVYAEAGFRQAGLDYEITYNGNIKYHFLPTEKTTKVCDSAKKFCSLAYFAPDSETRELLEQLSTIPGQNPTQKLKQFIQQMDGELRSYDGDFKGTVKMTTVSNLPDGQMAALVPEFSKTKGLVINLKITSAGAKNPMVVLEEMAHLRQICDDYNSYFKNPLLWAEMTKNAEYGSVRSQLFLAKAEIDAMDVITNDLLEEFDIHIDEHFLDTDDDPADIAQRELGQKVKKYIEKRKAHATRQVADLKKLEKVEKKKRNAMAKQWNTVQTQMQNSNLKLDDYIAQGNRKKVVELINTFMPWEDMEPTEIAAWQKWLKAMEKPTTNKKNKVLLFRGLEGDLVREGANEGEYFLMAKMLTKNQGNYTRRLRSLKTHRTKMVKKVNVQVPTDVPSIASIMQAHSHEPNGSPFLSASDFNTASSFSDSRGDYSMAAMLIDKDRFMTNAISTYGEQERMIPLIVFPDEIVAMGKPEAEADNGFGSSYREFDEDAFLAQVKKKIKRNITPYEKSSSGWNELRPTQEWWDSINPKGVSVAKSSQSCKKIIQLFLGNL